MVSQQDRTFIGRQQELEILSSALKAALSGKGQLVMLAGEPGIGKTRLSQELAALAEKSGAQVLWGRCYEHAGAPPYWPWIQAVRSYATNIDPAVLRQHMGVGAAHIADILPELFDQFPDLLPAAELDPEQTRFRLFMSIVSFLSAVSQTQPLVLVIEDLHWADESSLLLLEFIAREISASSVMVVGTYRDVEVAGNHPLTRTMGSLVRESHFQRVQLGGLSRAEVGEFVETSSGVAVGDAAIDALHQRTEGNPLFVGEVVGSVDPEELARDQSWIAGIPEAVREAILRRLNRLSEPCNAILRAASVIGRDFEFTLLRALSQDVGEDEFLDRLEEALGIGVIEPLPTETGRFQFSHALIQQAVYEEISPVRKAQAHASVGDALEELHSKNLNEYAGELARHYVEAGAVVGTEKMIRYSLVAGEKALETFGYEQALIHFSRVLDAKVENDGNDLDAESAHALYGLGRAQSATVPRHELPEAQRNLSRAFDYYASVGDATHMVDIAEFPFMRRVEGGRLIRRALELIPDHSVESGRLNSFLGSIQGMIDGDYISARKSFDRALDIARTEEDPGLEMRTLIFAAQVELWHFKFEESLKCSLSAIQLAISASDPRGEVTARYWAALCSRSAANWQEAQRQSSAILRPAEQLGDRYWLATAYNSIALQSIGRGDWESARMMNLRGLGLTPHDPRLLMSRVIMESLCGNQAEAEDYLERLEGVALRSEPGPNTANACLSFVAPMARTNLGQMRQTDVGDTAIAAILSSPEATPFFLTWARVGASYRAVSNNDVEAASDLYAALQPLAGAAVMNVNLHQVLGLLAGAIGHLDDAVVHFQGAAVDYSTAGLRPDLARTCFDHSAVLFKRDGSGDRETALQILDEGIAIANELGMTLLQEKSVELREQLGSVTTGGSAYPDSLTDREVEVLRLVAAGKSNQDIADELIITLRTAGNHVANILNKTGLANRTEAAAYAIRLDLV